MTNELKAELLSRGVSAKKVSSQYFNETIDMVVAALDKTGTVDEIRRIARDAIAKASEAVEEILSANDDLRERIDGVAADIEARAKDAESAVDHVNSRLQTLVDTANEYGRMMEKDQWQEVNFYRALVNAGGNRDDAAEQAAAVYAAYCRMRANGEGTANDG